MTNTANREPAWYAERIACLREFMTAERYDLFRRTVAGRTRYMTVLAENMYHGQNAAALIRHCEAFGVQRMHTVEALCRFEPNAAIARGTEQWVDVVRHPSTADALAALARGKTGNYLAFFPSYAYLQQVYEAFSARWPDIHTLVQQRSFDDAGRAEFLAQFVPHPAQTLLGFAVMGGIFGEGVDLVGDRLIGCAIVGVGLPQVNPRQEMLRRYYEEQSGCGFDYAYRYPGMNKVLQAAGRVVRTPQDKGVVLLLDDRFAQPDTARLFPPHWQHIQYLPGTAALETALAAFWDV